MSAFDDMVRRVAAGKPGSVAALRARLLTQPREWLVDQLLVTLGPLDGYRPRPVELDERLLVEHTARFGAWDTSACLLGAPPPAGLMIGLAARTPFGDELLAEAKDLLHALVSGVAGLTPVRRARLALTLPERKADVFSFLDATATALGHGETALLLDYPEVADGLVGDAVVAALRVVNGLELNEEVLYARRADLDAATLI
ncbi:hypothetical protein JOD54_001718 [Actinokineospora baliensis]|uniref:hypothetical protein n=1 Tax=Actinokineospora baliensis TaxID=547056 RepID=UPI00195EE60C|nr:hypothetical protein [Actinokineospora baliensis]MBM7771514.1 hypothetical protein [Actinokineospora baliensis]